MYGGNDSAALPCIAILPCKDTFHDIDDIKCNSTPSAAVRMAVATSGNACERSSQLREKTHTLPFLSRCICAEHTCSHTPVKTGRLHQASLATPPCSILIQAEQQRQTWALMPSYLYSARKGRPSSTPSCLRASGTPSVIPASMGFKGTPAHYRRLIAFSCRHSLFPYTTIMTACLRDFGMSLSRGAAAFTDK